MHLVVQSVRYHWDAHKSNPMNLFAATIGMVVNNSIVLWGLWVMLFDGKEGGRELTHYYLALNGLTTLGWGSVCFFLGGMARLAQTIESGELEPTLATPRDPLLLAGLSQSIAPALGDLIQGAAILVVLFAIAPLGMALRCTIFSFASAIAFLGLFIMAGSLAFFLPRGAALSQLFIECMLSLTFYPTGKVFTGRGRFLLYLTPAAVTGLLPMRAIELGGWAAITIAAAAAPAFLWISVRLFRLGVRRYQSTQYVMARA